MITAFLWLAMVEGGQALLVGLAPVKPELYRDSHPLAYKCTELNQSILPASMMCGCSTVHNTRVLREAQ